MGHSETEQNAQWWTEQADKKRKGGTGMANNAALASPFPDKSKTSPRQHRLVFNVNWKDNDANRPAVTSSYTRRVGGVHTGDATGYLVPLSICCEWCSTLAWRMWWWWWYNLGDKGWLMKGTASLVPPELLLSFPTLLTGSPNVHEVLRWVNQPN